MSPTSAIMAMILLLPAPIQALLDDWNVHEYNLVSGLKNLHNKAVWVAGKKVKDWQSCQAMCAANASCREFDYAASWNRPEYGQVTSFDYLHCLEHYN